MSARQALLRHPQLRGNRRPEKEEGSSSLTSPRRANRGQEVALARGRWETGLCRGAVMCEV